MIKKGRRSMIRSVLVVLVGLLIAPTGAMANNINLQISPVGGTAFFGILHTDSFDFTDVITVNVVGPVAVNASIITIGAGLNNIDFVSADLNGRKVRLSHTGFLETGSIDIDKTPVTGPLVLTIRGKSRAGGGTFASYSGTMNIILPASP